MARLLFILCCLLALGAPGALAEAQAGNRE